MNDVITRLYAWANTNTHNTPAGWYGDRQRGTRADGDQLDPERPRFKEWVTTSRAYDALGRVLDGAHPDDLVAHVFDTRLNAVGLGDWLGRRKTPPGADVVEARLREVLGGD